MALFRRRTTDNPPADKLTNANESPEQLRENLFRELGNRLGPKNEATLRADFQNHLDADPVNGAEKGWICLAGKLVETIDMFNEELNRVDPLPAASYAEPRHGSGGEGPVSPFTTFRKDG